MNQYYLYGIGNALVDLEYSVSNEELQQLEISKGMMTLLDEIQQSKLLSKLYKHQPHKGCGGSVANSVIALSQFGGRGFFSGKVASDELGCVYWDGLREGGVAANPSNQIVVGQTGRCVVLVTPDGERTMATFLGVSSELTPDDLTESALRDSSWFYTEGYLASSASARHTSLVAKKIAESAGVKTALSLSDPNMVKYCKDGLLEMIGSGVDLLFANESEALQMGDTLELTQAVEYLKTLSKQFVLTRGALGALIWDGQALLEILSNKVEVVDTLGAGDLFAGAFFFGLSQNWSYQKAGELAAMAAARLVTRYGARLNLTEIQTILRDFNKN